jgi:hypothetical protein
MSTAATSRDTALALWQGWAELWNGDLSQADRILASGLMALMPVVVIVFSFAGLRRLTGWRCG